MAQLERIATALEAQADFNKKWGKETEFLFSILKKKLKQKLDS